MDSIVIPVHGDIKTSQLVFMERLIREKNPNWDVVYVLESMAFIIQKKVPTL